VLTNLRAQQLRCIVRILSTRSETHRVTCCWDCSVTGALLYNRAYLLWDTLLCWSVYHCVLIGLPCCVGWFARLWRGWLKLLKTTPKGDGCLAWVGWFALLSWSVCSFCVARFALLCWLVCSFVKGVAKAYKNNSQRGWVPCLGGSVCLSVLGGGPVSQP
jgi:hypothetical protein